MFMNPESAKKMSTNIPSTTATLNIERYMEKDHSRGKMQAEMWGRDDFKSLIHSNMRGKSECKRVKKGESDEA